MRMLVLLLILATEWGQANGQGPCSWKLLATGDRAEDTTQFTMYLEMLVEEKVLQIQDLEPFVTELKKGKLKNPIPNRAETKYSFHYQEFQKLLKPNSLDQSKLLDWVESFVAKSQTVESQKEKSETDSSAIPVYIADDGSRFYKFTHPVLGEVYRILKPRGRMDVKEDWLKTIWSVRELKTSNGNPLEATNLGGRDKRNNKIVSRRSAARRACLALGKTIELPTRGDFAEITQFFNLSSKEGIKELLRLFPDSEYRAFWSSTIREEDDTHAWRFYGKHNNLYYNPRDYKSSVLCIERGCHESVADHSHVFDVSE